MSIDRSAAMESISATSCKVVTPYGQQLKEKLPWYPQELCNDWPHQASAMSFGESSIIKYGLSYPRRTGLDAGDEGDFVEYTEYFQDPNKSSGDHVEECFVHRGVCVLSLGPIGGPSYLKGIYRPLNSYGTGIGIRSVVKAEFSRSIDGVPGSPQGKESFVCLAERAGISLYSEDSCDSQVTYLPEFHIERIMPCSLGLLVIPIKQDNDSPNSPDKNLYLLSHPIKQVSRIWFRSNPAQDYIEYNGSGERLLGCDKDLCVFWSLKHDKMILRRLVKLEPADIMHSTAITMTNTFLQTASHDQTSTNPIRPLTPHPNLNLYSPFRRPSTSNGNRPSGNKYQDGSNIYYWPVMDQNSMNDASMNHGLAHGFYPPHICVYDEAEAYLRNLFHIDLAKGRWEVPHKFRFATAAPSYSISTKNRMALLSQIRTRIYLHGVDVNSGKKLSHYCIKDVQDFGCSNGERDGISFIVILQTTGEIKIGWFDNDFQIACSTVVQFDVRDSYVFKNIHNVFYGDTIVCGVQNSSKGEKVLIELKNFHKNGLICKTIEGFKKEINNRIVVQIIAKYMENSPNKKFTESEDVKVQSFFDYEWLEFLQVIEDVVSAEAVNQRGILGSKMLRVLESLKENLKIHGFAGNYLEKLQQLDATISKFTKSKSGKKTVPAKTKSVFLKFAELMMKDSPTSDTRFEDLPEVMQILLDNPDDVRNLERLVDIKAREASFAPAIEVLIADVLLRNQTKVKFDWPEAVVRAVGRFDYLSGINPSNSVMKDKVFQVFTPYRERDDVNEEVTWMSHVLKMQIFSEDRRLEEVCRLLDSASPLVIDVEQRAEMSDHEYVEEQEKNLLQLVQVAFSAPVGRAAFTLRTEEKNFANLTSHIFLPKLCISGKCATKGTSIDLNDSDLPASYTAWPTFHNAVASALAVRFLDSPADAWFAYNKTKTNEGSEQAGMVLGFGLNGILSSMPPTLRHEYLAKENSFTTMAMLLGLSANLAGSGDIQTWKLISLHISAMLPACTTELEIPRFATLVAPLSLGLLFLGTHNSHIAKVLLGEISKRYSPLSVFGTNAFNNSATNVNISEMSAISPDREAHTLCAGFGLGFVNLGKGRLNDGSLEEGIDGILRRFVVGGPKPAHPHADEEEVMNQYGQSLPSLWEEYRCCHIEEGDNVNVDVTSPAAIIAVSLIYLRSGNEAVLKWLSPPSTLHLLDGVRPDLLVLRALASILVFDHVPEPDVTWLEDTLMPEALIENALKQPEKNSRTDHESINQAWASIMCGYCLGLGIRYAGTSDAKVKSTLWHYTNLILKISSADSKLSEYFPKNFLESSVCSLLISLALVCAGTGEVQVLRLCRYLQSKVALTSITTTSNTYGLEMCVSMATGILFLGGGRYSLSNDDKSIAVLLAAVFPKWPINANDNRYHLQALRHLYVLAAQPRLILPKPVPKNNTLKFFIEFLDGQTTEAHAPVLLPPFYLIKKIRMESQDFMPIEFNLPQELEHLKKIVEGGGVINLVSKPQIAQGHGFVRKMSWRQEHSFHSTFRIDKETPSEERFIIEGFNLISRLAEWSGIPHTIPAFLDLKSGDPQNQDWMWQIRILYWWMLKCNSKGVLTAIHNDLLANIVEKAEGKLELFPETQVASSESPVTTTTHITRSHRSEMEH